MMPNISRSEERGPSREAGGRRQEEARLGMLKEPRETNMAGVETAKGKGKVSWQEPAHRMGLDLTLSVMGRSQGASNGRWGSS